MLAAGVAAVLATGLTWVLDAGARRGWAVSFLTFSLEFALILLAAVIGASLLMPTTMDLTRPIRRDEETSASTILTLALVALAAAAALQVPLLMSWWAADRMLLSDATGSSPDPMGLRIIPMIILFSIPTLAATALATFVLTSILGIVVRAEHALHVLMSCAVIQIGLVAGVHLLLREMRHLSAQILPLLVDARDPTMTAQVTDWFARHDAASAPLSWPLIWIVGGYLGAIAIKEFLTTRTEVASTVRSTPSVDSPASGTTGPPAIPPLASPSAASSAFDYSNYCVRPRRTFLESLIVRSYSEYDIETIPPMSRARFSFSWKTGAVRREPNGPDILTVQPSDRQGLLGPRSYVVIDTASGRALGTVVPNVSEWEIVDPRGDSIARVAKESGGVGLAIYVATVHEQVVCRFTWGMPGYLAHSSELEVEFPAGADVRFDRAFAIALAPILEHKARMASERAVT